MSMYIYTHVRNIIYQNIYEVCTYDIFTHTYVVLDLFQVLSTMQYRSKIMSHSIFITLILVFNPVTTVKGVCTCII